MIQGMKKLTGAQNKVLKTLKGFGSEVVRYSEYNELKFNVLFALENKGLIEFFEISANEDAIRIL